MQKIPSIILSILSGLLLILAWPVGMLTPLIFLAWIPLFLLAEKEKIGVRFFVFTYISMLIWNAGTTWWIWNSTGPGAVSAIMANSLLMCLPLQGFSVFKRRYGNSAGWLALVVFWLSFEYIHLNWQLSWPWLTLGNVFSDQPSWIQWYEYTGVSGGSLWVLLVNILLYITLFQQKKKTTWGITTALVAILPVLASVAVKPAVAPTASTNVVIVQPNIDPYTEKFDMGSTSTQISKLISLSEQGIDTNTRLVLWPETALPVAVWQDQIQSNPFYQPVFAFLHRHPQVTLQTGIETLKNYGAEKATNTARRDGPSGVYYDVFNAAIAVKDGKPVELYNKSKLVPGVETLPDFLIWMSSVFEKFGGTAGGYGRDTAASIFKQNGSPYVTAPIICYESIYGEYVTTYVQKGANLLTIMTNDGWWGNTPGHKQHLQYARLRALETRKWVARSANTGISAVIDNVGNVVETRPWKEAAYIRFSIPTAGEQTFYVRNGPVIFKVAIFLLFVLFGYHFVMLLKVRFVKRR